MYVLRAQFAALPGKTVEFEAWNKSLSTFLIGQQGCLRASLNASLGYPGRYTGLATFTDAQAAKACMQGPLVQYLAQNPAANVATVTAPLEAWEIIQSSLMAAAQPGNFLAAATVTVDAAQAPAFEANRKQLIALIEKEGRGVVGCALGRFLGTPNQFVLSTVYTGRAEAERTRDIPALRGFREANPATNFGGTAPAIEFLEVVHSLVPATVVQR